MDVTIVVLSGVSLTDSLQIVSTMTMIPLVGFIGWHNSGKTTLASKVVEHLTARGHAVGVIKSTKDIGIASDTPGTDTHTYAKAGAAGVALAAPDQLVVRTTRPDLNLHALAGIYFSTMDIVIVEGFKYSTSVPKIEVHRAENEFLYSQVDNVIALVADEPVQGIPHFHADQSEELATMIEETFCNQKHKPLNPCRVSLDGHEVTLPPALEQTILQSLLGWALENNLHRQDKTTNINIEIS